MKQYNAVQVAIELGMPGTPKDAAKKLRNMLRAEDSGFTAPGSGGSWVFTTADLPKLKSLIERNADKPKSKTRSTHTIEDAPGLSHRDAKDSAKVAAITKERVDRLEAALRAKGLHISQMKQRNTFRDLIPA